MSVAAQVATLEEEIERLRSALARAEEEAGLWEARYDVLHRKRNRLLDENAALETQLAAIVERTEKAQREKCAAEWTGQPSGLVSECIRSVSLVTLSALPEADSGGGGESYDRGIAEKIAAPPKSGIPTRAYEAPAKP